MTAKKRAVSPDNLGRLVETLASDPHVSAETRNACKAMLDEMKEQHSVDTFIPSSTDEE